MLHIKSEGDGKEGPAFEQLKMDIIVKLHEYGYPPITQEDVYKNVLEQAENFKKNVV